AQAVLGCVENVLVRVEEAARLGHSSNRRELASCGVSSVLVMDLKSQTDRRAEACQQRDSHLDLSHGCRESDMGSAAHSRRTSEAGFRGLGKECFAMDPASSERSRSCEAMADVPQKPSRGHCGNGLLHRPNAHVWCFVLLFRHQPRPAEDSTLQCDAKSQCALGCTAIARSMGLQTAAQILAIRLRRKVWSRGGFGCNSLCARKEDSILSETRRATPSLCGGSVDSRAVFLSAKFFSETRPGTVHVLCEHFRGSTKSACNPKPKNLRQGERNPSF